MENLFVRQAGPMGLNNVTVYSGVSPKIDYFDWCLNIAVLSSAVIVKPDSPFFLYLISHLDLFMTFWCLTENMNKECPIRWN